MSGAAMNLRISILGTEVFAISTDSAEPEGAPDALSTPVGFTARYDVPEMAEPTNPTRWEDRR